MSVLVVVDHNQNQIKQATLKAITAAQQMDAQVDLLLLSDHAEVLLEQLKPLAGVHKILVAEHQAFEHRLAEDVAPTIVKAAQAYTAVLAAATSFAKDVMPRVAALLDVAQISDVIEVIDATTFKHPIYAGNAIETLQSLDDKQVLTVRATAFDAVGISDTMAPVETLNVEVEASPVAFVSMQAQGGERPELSSARVVVSGGRGLQSKENFDALGEIADKLNAALGASRAVVDAGMAPNDLQVGQTGQVVAPELYIAIGISGAIQHLAGMKDSKVIVAINKDDDAPIFQVADYGLVADWFAIKDEFMNAL